MKQTPSVPPRYRGGLSCVDHPGLRLRALLGCFLSLLLLGSSALCRPPQNPPDVKVDAAVRAEMEQEKIPGLALGVYRDGKIVRAEGYGFANLEWDAPVGPDTLFQSGSVGKQFAATAIMMLVESGKVGLDDSIRKYFPDAPDSWKPIAVRNLLTHTSGLAEYESEERTKPGAPFYLRLDVTEDQLYRKITQLPIEFKPGEAWAYRNTNYVLLGILIRKVTGEFYGDYLKEKIFAPLGMVSTRIISEEDILRHRAAGYSLDDKGQLKNQEWVSPSYNSTADGALYFTVLDLEKWDAALYTEELLKKSSLDQMWTPCTLRNGKHPPYGFGWRVDQANGHKLLEHSGAWQGFTTHIARYVDDRLTVVVLTNLDSEHSNPGKIAHQVAALYNPDLSLAAAKPIPDEEPRVTSLLRSTLADLASAHLNLDSFAPDQRDSWTPNRTKRLGEVVQSFGPLESLDLLKRDDTERESRSYSYRATFSKRLAEVNLTLNPSQKITALEFLPE
jgi:CubicO group peptidase (beta-lactamase class C family)